MIYIIKLEILAESLLFMLKKLPFKGISLKLSHLSILILKLFKQLTLFLISIGLCGFKKSSFLLIVEFEIEVSLRCFLLLRSSVSKFFLMDLNFSFSYNVLNLLISLILLFILFFSSSFFSDIYVNMFAISLLLIIIFSLLINDLNFSIFE